MCGRFVLASPPEVVAAYFDAVLGDAPTGPRYNVAPTDDIAGVLVREGRRELDRFRWGLIPPWANNASIGVRMINARAEGLASSNAFRRSFERRRCIVVADGFYEWATTPGRRARVPHYITRPDGSPYAFAGLWSRWSGPMGGEQVSVRSATIITTEPNEAMATIHDRMPVVLAPESWERWLDPTHTDTRDVGDLLVPAAPELTVIRPVAALVNNVRNDGPALIADLPAPDELPDPDAEQGTLF